LIQKRICVGFLATLPPTKGISDYSLGFLSSIPSTIDVECYAISKLCPDFLYPGGGSRFGGWSKKVNLPRNITAMERLAYSNWNKWVRAGLTTKANVFHIHWWTPFLVIPYFLLMLMLKSRHIPIVLTVHNVRAHENALFHSAATGIMVRLADHIIVHTYSGKQLLASIYSVEKQQISVQPHGLLKPIDSGISLSKTEARDMIGLSQDDFILLFFGNIRHYKGLDTLIEALKLVTNQNDKVKLLIAGMPWKGSGDVRKLTEDADIKNQVILELRFIKPKEIQVFFECSDVVVLPYRFFDAQTGVGLFGIYFEKPLIVTRVGGLPELVLDEEVIVPPENPAKFADAILRVSQDLALQAKLKQDSKTIKQRFQWATISTETANIYYALVRSR
jgi:glycosyltransferase involved in cell wall biosynthesis